MGENNPYAPPQFPIGKGPPLRLIPRRIKARLLAIGVCYAVSLLLPLFYDSPNAPWLGIAFLALAWVVLHPAWFANPLLLLGMLVLAMDRPKGALLLGLLATFAALSPLLIGGLDAWRFLGIGYYLWLASMVMLVLASRDHIAQSRLEEYAEG